MHFETPASAGTDRGHDRPDWSRSMPDSIVHGSTSRYRKGCRCDACREAHRVEAARYREKNREKDRAYQAAYHQRYRDRHLERQRAYRQGRIEIAAEYRVAHRERDAEYRRAYAQTARGRLVNRSKVLRRRARKRDADHGCVTTEFLERLYSLPCVYCGAPAEHADHIFPLSKGGLHCIDNLAPSCQPCNDRKWAKILEHPPAAPLRCPLNATSEVLVA